MRYFDAKEVLDPADRLRQQWSAFSSMASLAYRKSPAARRMFDESGVDPATSNTLEDFEKLPVISREKLVQLQQEAPPYGGLCGGDSDIDRIFISPGPVYEPHLSESDPMWARGYYAAGFGKGDVVLNTFSYHMVAAGLTFHNGLRRVGATVVPSGTSSTEQQVQLIRDLRVTGYTGTPSFLLAIIKKAEEMGYDFAKDFRLQRANFVAEPLQQSLRQLFEREYSIDSYQMYGATEVGDIAYECSEKHHWHICDEVIVEIVDPTTGKNMKPGQLGEVVVTRPNEIFFLFRFGTGDLSSLVTEPCPCGRTSFRLSGISGRVGEATKVRGMFITPSQMRLVSSKLGDLEFKVIVDRADFRDLITAILELPEGTADPNAAATEFSQVFRQVCTVKVDHIEFAKAGSLSPIASMIEDRRDWR